MQADTLNYSLPAKPDKNSAMVYIVRPAELSGYIKYSVFLDSNDIKSEVGHTYGGNYIYFKVTPGRHMIYSKILDSASIYIEPEAGETIFIKQQSAVGVMRPTNKVSVIDAVEGKYWVKNTIMGKINPKLSR